MPPVPNPELALSRCPHALECSGCDYLGYAETDQDALKEGRIRDAFRTFALDERRVLPIAAAEKRFGYRTRAKLVVTKSAIGLFRRGTHEVVSTDGCAVLAPALENLIHALRSEPLFDLGVSGLDLRVVDDGVLLTLITEIGAREPELEALAKRLREVHPNVLGIAKSVRRRDQVALLGTDHRLVEGTLEARHHIGDLPYHIATHGSFVQAHGESAANLYVSIASDLEARVSKARVLELHAGSGTLSLTLARGGHDVTAVESYAPALELLERAAKEQKLEVRSIASVAAEWLKSAPTFDVVLLNPPRRGLEADLRKRLPSVAPKLLYYVSCDPLSLSRDLRHLALLGFELESARPFDLMPGAAIVETLAILKAGPLPPPKVLFEDAELVAVLKEPHESTHPQGDRLPSLLDRVRLLPGANEAVPVHRLDAETSGVCLFAKHPRFVSGLADALREGKKSYFALAKGITHKGGTIKKPVQDGKHRRDATTRYERVGVSSGHSLVRIHPSEGRRHQIRQHFRTIGHPLVGDSRYGDPKTNQHFFSKHHLDRTALHCASIELGGSRSGVLIEAPIPPDVASLFEPSRLEG